MSWFAQPERLPCSFMALAILTARIFDPAPVNTVSATTLGYLPTSSGSAPRSPTPGQALGLSCIFKVHRGPRSPPQDWRDTGQQEGIYFFYENSCHLTSAAQERGLSVTQCFWSLKRTENTAFVQENWPVLEMWTYSKLYKTTSQTK